MLILSLRLEFVGPEAALTTLLLFIFPLITVLLILLLATIVFFLLSDLFSRVTSAWTPSLWHIIAIAATLVIRWFFGKRWVS